MPLTIAIEMIDLSDIRKKISDCLSSFLGKSLKVDQLSCKALREIGRLIIPYASNRDQLKKFRKTLTVKLPSKQDLHSIAQEFIPLHPALEALRFEEVTASEEKDNIYNLNRRKCLDELYWGIDTVLHFLPKSEVIKCSDKKAEQILGRQKQFLLEVLDSDHSTQYLPPLPSDIADSFYEKRGALFAEIWELKEAIKTEVKDDVTKQKALSICCYLINKVIDPFTLAPLRRPGGNSKALIREFECQVDTNIQKLQDLVGTKHKRVTEKIGKLKEWFKTFGLVLATVVTLGGTFIHNWRFGHFNIFKWEKTLKKKLFGAAKEVESFANAATKVAAAG